MAKPFKIPITPQMREIQYKGNKKFISFLDENSCTHYDWMVTAIFYSALHLIDKALQQKGQTVRRHSDRNQLVIFDRIFGNDIADAYRALFNEGMASRYDCLPIIKKRVDDALKSLNIIEKQLH